MGVNVRRVQLHEAPTSQGPRKGWMGVVSVVLLARSLYNDWAAG
jgi:hypothetical protein